METGDHFKNGASPKSQTNRGNQFMKLGMLAVTCALLGIMLNSCGVLSTVATVRSELADALGIYVSTPSPKMIVQMTNNGELIENGKTFMLEFLLTNNTGVDIKTYQFRADLSDSNQVAYDNLGNKCEVYAKIGGDYDYAPLPVQTPVKVRVFVTGFSSEATSFSRITISGFCSHQTCEGTPDDYISRNLTIPRQ
jgi:hypothetical protein